VLGPTASGKSSLGLAVAERYEEKSSTATPTAVYRGFDIGTDKLTLEQRRGIPHHLIDIEVTRPRSSPATPNVPSGTSTREAS